MRKRPTQRRAVSMVESLVEAATQLVARDGLDALTTGRVAERAGVSVGSLYQYFASRDELVLALAERVTSDFIAALDRVAATALRQDPQSFLRALMTAALEVLELRGGLAREIIRQRAALTTRDTLQRLERRVLELLLAYALAHVHDHPINPTPVRAFVMFNSVVFTLQQYLNLAHPATFSTAALLDELVTMSGRLLMAP